jgi:betaine-aldehyde dehydrogenase
MTTLPFLIANDWTQGGGEPFDSINPADGSVAARIAGASVADVDRAVAAARRALRDPAWQGLRAHERARLLLRFAELVERDRDVLARAQMMDNGKTLKECRSQAASAALVFRYYAAVCETAEGDVTTQRGAAMTLAIDEPMGVVAAITPWNSPLTIEAQKLAPILAAGNAVVLKPSEVTPQVALHYGKIAIEAGFPAGVVNVVTGFGDVGRALVEHRDVDMVSFTGGTVAGRHIAEAAGRRLCPVLLELGGKSPNVVFADADMAKAARGVAAGIFGSGGQSCVAGSRVFVERAILDDFVARFVTEAAHYRPGHPESDDAAIGPIRRARMAARS